MFKIMRVLIGTALGFFVANYLGFMSVHGINYLWGTLIVVAIVFVFRGFHF